MLLGFHYSEKSAGDLRGSIKDHQGETTSAPWFFVFLCLCLFRSHVCRLVGSVQSVGKHNELLGRGVLLRPIVLLPLLLPGCSVRDGGQPRQPAGPHAHEVQHVVLQLQRRTAQHHPDRWVRGGGLSCCHCLGLETEKDLCIGGTLYTLYAVTAFLVKCVEYEMF